MNENYIIIDRIENGFAVCETNGVMENITLSSIDGNVREGSVLIANESKTRYSVDTRETENRRSIITERFNKIKGKNRRNAN